MNSDMIFGQMLWSSHFQKLHLKNCIFLAELCHIFAIAMQWCPFSSFPFGHIDFDISSLFNASFRLEQNKFHHLIKSFLNNFDKKNKIANFIPIFSCRLAGWLAGCSCQYHIVVLVFPELVIKFEYWSLRFL